MLLLLLIVNIKEDGLVWVLKGVPKYRNRLVGDVLIVCRID